MSKIKLAQKHEDVSKLQKMIISYGEGAETELNEYIHNEGRDELVSGITQEMPVSDRNKRHAKFSIWHEIKNYNLGVVISNNNTGKNTSLSKNKGSKTSFYYLAFVVDGTKHIRANDFFTKGAEKKYSKIVDGLLKALNKNL